MKRNRLTLIISILLLFRSTSPAAAQPVDGTKRPNIVFLLGDDLGWNDVSFHGSDIATPVIDALAAQGVRLEQFYVCPVCTPTRGCLMTGRYPIRYGLQKRVIEVESQYGLPLQERTLPQVLKEAGYRTAILGKWHLGHFAPDYLPQNRGFDFQYGMYWGRIDYFTHEIDKPVHDPGVGLDWHRNGKPLRQEGYSTTLIGEEAASIIESHDFSQPLFLYVPFNAPHGPAQAAPQYLARSSSITDAKRRNYAAVVYAIDDAVARIIQAIEKRKIGDNTLIIFSSDNGGMLDNGGSNLPLHGSKGELYEGGVRVPAIAVWPGKIKPATVSQEPLHMMDWYPTFAGLAGASLEQKLPLDGMNIWPVLTEGKPSPHKEILLNIDPSRQGAGIRAGNWKLIIRPEQKPELYDISRDPNEKDNLAEAQSEKVNELKARLDYYGSQAIKPLQDTTTPKKGIPAVIGG